jgi:hypothetical protein
MTNEKALRLIQLGLTPVLLGSEGDDLKRPILKGWQMADYTTQEVAAWPVANNLGIRCGRLPRHSRGGALTVFDFDEEAEWIFPAWRRRAERIVACLPVIVTSGRGYHVYFFTEDEQPGRTLAGRYRVEDGRQRLDKFIETLGRGRQVVTAGSRHPNGRRYQFVGSGRYADIPVLSQAEYQALLALACDFDERPARAGRPGTAEVATLPARLTSQQHSIGSKDCLEYARHYIGTAEQVERNGDIRFLGQGGLVVTADGRGWYSFSDETGGGLTELIAWHRGLVGER